MVVINVGQSFVVDHLQEPDISLRILLLMIRALPNVYDIFLKTYSFFIGIIADINS